MNRSLPIWQRRLAARITLCCATLAASVALAPHIADAQVYMMVEGITARPGEGFTDNKAGKSTPEFMNSFKISSFEVSVDAPPMEKASLGDVNFNLAILEPALKLWELATTGQHMRSATLFVVVGTDVTYRIDLDDVVVRSMGLQTLGERDAAVGALSYARIRLTKGATTVAWDRSLNRPAK